MNAESVRSIHFVLGTVPEARIRMEEICRMKQAIIDITHH